MKKAWRTLAALGFISALGALSLNACVITSGDDDETGGTSGTGGSSGSTGGTAGTGGSAGSTGGTAGSAGSAGTAGSGGSGVQCDDLDGGAIGTPGSCEPADPNDACQVCVKDNCCTEYSECIATNPDNVCGWGGPNGEGEVFCFQECLINAGVADPTTQQQCAGNCGTPACGGIIGDKTNVLIACLNNKCFSECLQP